MENLNTYINEKLRINKNTIQKKYKYFPKDRSELYEIIVNIARENREIAESGTLDLNSIDVSSVTDFTKLFNTIIQAVTLYNVDISDWDVSNVESFNNCFCGLQHFNCDLSGWDVGNGKIFQSMFEGCYEFNSDLSNWDLSNAEDVRFMFVSCFRFDSDVSKWDLRKVNSISRMFDNCLNFRGIGIDKMKLNPEVIYDRAKHRLTFENCKKIKKLPAWYENNK